jgi:hypothetical protein
MKTSDLSRCGSIFCVAAIMLSGCSGSHSGISPSLMTPSQTSSAHANGTRSNAQGQYSTLVTYGALHGMMPRVLARRGTPHFSAPPKSVMMKMHPNAAGGPFFYLTDAGSNTLYIYKYTFGYVTAFYAAITAGMNEPQGACAGKSQAPGTVGKSIVWVTNTLSSQIYGFTRGPGGLPKTSPTYIVNVLHPNPGYFPVGCSLDPVTGNLAVTNIEDVNGGNGNVAIFAPSDQAVMNGGPSANVNAPNIFRYYFLGYDRSGNLWVDGLDSTLTTFEFAKCPPGCGVAKVATLNKHISSPGQIQWDAETKWLEVNDQGSGDGSVVDEFAMRGARGTLKCTSLLKGDVVQSWLDVKSDRLFGPDAANGHVNLYQHSGCHTGSVLQSGPGYSIPIGSALLR